jgi:hypothetical protein
MEVGQGPNWGCSDKENKNNNNNKNNENKILLKVLKEQKNMQKNGFYQDII